MVNSTSGTNNSQQEIPFNEAVKMLVGWTGFFTRKWLLFSLFGILGSAFGLLYSLLTKPIYTAATTFVLEEEKSSGLTSLSGLASVAGLDLGGSSGGIFQGDNILELYRSRKMIQETLLSEVLYDRKQQPLVNLYIKFNSLDKEWANNPELKNLRFPSNYGLDESLHRRSLDSLIGIFVDDINKNYLTVGKPDKKLNIFKAEIKSKNEFFAKVFNDRIVQNVNNFYIETKTKKSLQNVSILQDKTDSVRSVMNKDIYSASLISDATPNLNPTRQVQRNAPIQKSQFSAETNKAIASELVKNLELSKLTLLKETPLIQVVDSPIYPLKVMKVSKLKGAVLGAFTCCFFLFVYLFIVRFLRR